MTGLVFALTIAVAASAPGQEIDIAAWAKDLPNQFVVLGSKVEPTYVAAVEIRRDGDTLSIVGGAPAWMERSRETIEVDMSGDMRHLVCPPGMTCQGAPRPAGFLSTAALLSASRRGALSGSTRVETYGGRNVICLPAETLGVEKPILDPCFDLASGAAIAQKNRFSGRFDGPSLDPVTLRVLPDTIKENSP
ncbi:hypothetical protein [Rhizobium sp. FKL33]|uniref:hypothetical protein n=1 Tax=Rhizobium sp. FKL33 TaxID=2562307 RepID=UPI0010BFC3C4|nr:hypothetical protein [Rhizobium sp. FKL33]